MTRVWLPPVERNLEMRFALIRSLLLMLGGVLTAAPAQSDSGGRIFGPEGVKPFQVHVPNEVLSDLHRRLANARWPDQLPGTSWEYALTFTRFANCKLLAEWLRLAGRRETDQQVPPVHDADRRSNYLLHS